jgi:GNAT superfamily N-acetyltransferase
LEFSILKRNQRGDLCELNKELVVEWYNYSLEGQKLTQTSWEDLTPRERYVHGGPWVDLQTLDVHLDLFEKFGQVLIATDSSIAKIVGELEYHFSGKSAHIDWMMVSPNSQNRGIGTKMIQGLIEIVKQNGYNRISTEPEKGSETFYSKNGFAGIQPHLLQLTKNGSSPQDNNHWISGIPQHRKYLIGDATNTPEYSLFLLAAEIEYTKIFNLRDVPVGWTLIENSIEQTTIIRRKISIMSNKSSLLLASNHQHDNGQIQNFFNKVTLSLPKSEQTYITLTGSKPTGWEISNKIIKMQMSI